MKRREQIAGGLLALVVGGLVLSNTFRQHVPQTSLLPIPLSPPSLTLTNAPPLFHEEFVDRREPTAMVHAASLCELPDGTLAAVWYGGSREGAADISIFFSTHSPNKDWAPQRPIMTRDSAMAALNRYVKKLGNSVLFSDSDGRLHLIFASVAVGGWSGSSLNLATSRDRGETWSAPQRLTLSPFFNISELPRNKPVRAVANQFAVPIYHECLGKFPEILWIHYDSGVEAWRWRKTRIAAGRTFLQPSIVPGTSDHALVFLRNAGPKGAVTVSTSNDRGATWNDPSPISLPNPDSGLDAVRLRDGRILLAFNDSDAGRENLSLAVSSDEARTWERLAILEQERGAEFSYPALVLSKDGTLHLLYTWKRKRIKHVAFNESWLNSAQRISPTRHE